ncbi:ABC transporter ATP-binding protein [bacterium]|nr:ABC transporter ATP-binding protein [bacterium]
MKARETLGNLKRLFSFLLPFWPIVVLCCLLSLITSSTTLIFPWLIKGMFNSALLSRDVHTLNKLLFISFGVLALEAIASYLQTLNFAYLGAKVSTDLRIKLFNHIQNASFRYFQRIHTGDILSRLMNDVGTVQSLISSEITNLIRQPFLLIGGFILMLTINLRLSLLLLLYLPIFLLIATPLGRKVKEKARAMQERLANMTSLVQDALSGIIIVKTFLLENYLTRKLEDVSRQFIETALKNAQYRALMSSLGLFGGALPFLCALGYGSILVLNNQITPGGLVAFIWYMALVIEQVAWLSGTWANLQTAVGAGERLFQVLDEPKELEIARGTIELKDIKGEIIFSNVSFTYTGEEVLKNINIHIRAGEKVAIVGPTGAGKSTLVALLLRLYDPTEGDIYLDGINLKKIKPSSLRKFVCAVPQDTIIFAGSVRENIAIGNLEASEEEIIESAKLANAHDFIMDLPQGYDTVLGERGAQLSGGERQRIALARAFLRKPRVLILDEATASLDSETEMKIYEAMERLFAGRTAIIIAHRLSTVRFADRILVLYNGQIVEEGTHNELIRNNGLYAKLYSIQAGERYIIK